MYAIRSYYERLGLTLHLNKVMLKLSGGLKRRFMIAKALIHRPQLLILDEPTAGVDVELRHGLWDFVREINQQGTTILLTVITSYSIHYTKLYETSQLYSFWICPSLTMGGAMRSKIPLYFVVTSAETTQKGK